MFARSFTIAEVKTWDVIIVGGGIIGLSLAIALRKRGATVLVVERGEPGREASHAAGGMLVDCPLETPSDLQSLATASARMYPGFAHELEFESEMKVDLRDQGTILFPDPQHADDCEHDRDERRSRQEPANCRPWCHCVRLTFQFERWTSLQLCLVSTLEFISRLAVALHTLYPDSRSISALKGHRTAS